MSLAPNRLWEVDECIEHRRVSLDNLRVEGGRRHHADDPAQVDAGAVVVARPGYDGDLFDELHTYVYPSLTLSVLSCVECKFNIYIPSWRCQTLPPSCS